jgi:hypothetical protein
LFDRIEAKVAAREGKETSCALQKKKKKKSYRIETKKVVPGFEPGLPEG